MIDNPLWWLLIIVVIVSCIIFYGKFLLLSTVLVKISSKDNSNSTLNIIIVTVTLVVIYSILAPQINQHYHQKKTKNRITQIMEFERTSLVGRLPNRYVQFFSLKDEELRKLEKTHNISPVSASEKKRIYRLYSRYQNHAYNCYRLYKIGSKSPPTMEDYYSKEKCDSFPRSLPEALKLEEPILFLLSGANTTMRDTPAGIMNEVRLITPEDSFLIEYYEMRPSEDLLKLDPRKRMFKSRYDYGKKIPPFNFYDSVLASGSKSLNLRKTSSKRKSPPPK